ncbi:YpmS family protein [Sporosarcina sp. G11-34]|uniref:YpmS family protein n=1 Tax=Sporosarcina sp. G11-34 TaxID=2849605 RepID=UPI0022A8E5DB|nr:YpmS family protein [Sporosarcina sp. G11-34]MCZ2258253.1 YpmS family protein [Sporosarcina sp. G11-34]
MNFWKVGFFVLFGLIAAAVVALVVFISSSPESVDVPNAGVSTAPNHLLTVRATKEDFEGIANTYIRKAMDGEPLPVTLEVKDNIVLTSELTVFAYTLPVTLFFDPIVREDGNLILKQTSVEIGKLNIPPSTVLKILKDSVKLPPWMIVRPKEEELFINLSAIPVSGDLEIKAKEFNLAKDEIILEIVIPKD